MGRVKPSRFTGTLVCLLCITGKLTFANEQQRNAPVVTVDFSTYEQTMKGFGASDAWSVDEVGRFYPDKARRQAAKWLFSKDISSQGTAEGIGLSMWRFNIGAGSSEQGDDAQISNPLRRVEGFLQNDGSYNWNKQLGQQWFLHQAKDFGVESLVAFSNSPPVQYTQNGIAHGSPSIFDANLWADKYNEYAVFLATVLKHFEDEGIVFDYVSPLNEPQYQWADSKQEGSPWKNHQIAKLARALDAELSKEQLNTDIMLSEAAEYRYLSGLAHKRNKDFHSDQIEAFFNPDSVNYIGDLKHVPKMVAGHSYWTVYNDKQIVQQRKALADKASQYGLTFYQSEYCLLGLENITDHKPALNELDIGLFMAKIIHYDLTISNAASWSFWTSLSRTNQRAVSRYLLIEKQHQRNQDFSEASVRASKSLWILGNYSRFVRPGYVRLNTANTLPSSDVLVSSYLSPNKQKLVSVMVNLSNKPVEITIDTAGQFEHKQVFVSDESRDLKGVNVEPTGNVTLPARSVVTLLSDTKS